MACEVQENTLRRPIAEDRLLQYETVRFVVNGEPLDADVLNRPLYDFMNNLTTMYYDKKQLRDNEGASYVGVESSVPEVTTVQEAVDYIEENMVYKSRKIIVGEGLRGGGDLSEDVFIETFDTLLTTNVDQTVLGTKTFTMPPQIQGEVVGNKSAVTIDYAKSEIESASSSKVPATRKIEVGEGLIGGGQLGDDVVVKLDQQWVRDMIEESFKNYVLANVTTLVSEAVAAAAPK